MSIKALLDAAHAPIWVAVVFIALSMLRGFPRWLASIRATLCRDPEAAKQAREALAAMQRKRRND